MGERKARHSSKKISNRSRKMASSETRETSLGNGASIVRCPSPILKRFRSLKEAEYVVLFTPVVPHPPGAESDLTMDPFEPLGRAIYRHHKRIRHVPYVPKHGMTSTHIPFIHHAGAVIVVVCSTPAASVNLSDYHDQRSFANSVLAASMQDPTLTEVPVVLLLVTYDTRQVNDDFQVFPAVVATYSYTPSALETVANTIFTN